VVTDSAPPDVRVFVQTRGAARATDYAFLGGAPPDPWWRAYRDATAFDHPTVLVTGDGERWAAYLSGIPSGRVDAVGTVVRYTLVLDGPCGSPEGDCVVAAVAAWLAEVAGEGSGLPEALDARFPPDDVQRWLADPPARGTADEVRRRALAALATLPARPAATDEPGSWVGAVGAGGPRRTFTARVAALAAGRRGRALLLNLVGPDEAVALVDPASPVAVLVESTDPRLSRVMPLRAEVEAKKVPPPPSARRVGAAVAGVTVPLVMVTVLALAVLTVLVLLL
jgi:hypothetical protein